MRVLAALDDSACARPVATSLWRWHACWVPRSMRCTCSRTAASGARRCGGGRRSAPHRRGESGRVSAARGASRGRRATVVGRSDTAGGRPRRLGRNRARDEGEAAGRRRSGRGDTPESAQPRPRSARRHPADVPRATEDDRARPGLGTRDRAPPCLRDRLGSRVHRPAAARNARLGRRVPRPLQPVSARARQARDEGREPWEHVVGVAREVDADVIALGWAQELAAGRARVVRPPSRTPRCPCS